MNLPRRRKPKMRRELEADEATEIFMPVLSKRDMDALLYACSRVILGDRRRSMDPVSTERRVNNLIDDVSDVSMKLSKLSQQNRVRHT